VSLPGEQLTDRQIDLIAGRLAERLGGAVAAPAPVIAAARPAALGEGIFATVDDAVAADHRFHP
jgi:hypothetical protein